MMSMNGIFAEAYCELCAKICDECAQECVMLKDNHCQKYADIFHMCTNECRNIYSM